MLDKVHFLNIKHKNIIKCLTLADIKNYSPEKKSCMEKPTLMAIIKIQEVKSSEWDHHFFLSHKRM